MIAVESPIREFYDFYEIQPISAGWGVCQILIAYSPNLAAAVAAMLLSGVIWGPYLALEATLAQRLVTPEQHGQIFGIRTCLLTPTAPLGTAVGGGLLNLLQLIAPLGRRRISTNIVRRFARLAALSIWKTSMWRSPKLWPPSMTHLPRGLAVILLLPAMPQLATQAVMTAKRQAFLAERARLATYDNFTLCGIAGVGAEGERKPVYVHAKLMLIDDEWATVGSCNLHHYSLFGNGELNVAFRDATSVQAMRVELFQEHLATDTSALDDVAALRLFRQIASENGQRHEAGDPYWQGLAFRLDVTTYGQQPQF